MIRMPHSTRERIPPTSPAGPVVVKVGGGLLGIPGALDAVCAALAARPPGTPVVVVPGGGPFADAVRGFERQFGLSADAGHWMALLAMDQYAHALAERIGGAQLVEEAGAASAAWRRGRIPVLAPSRWMRSADVLPHGWQATSDSVAAFVAGALDAVRLVLVKPVERMTEPVDQAFEQVLPAGLPVTIVPWNRLPDALRPAG
jgi:aspartokinase-like uncharacterized kinase